MISEPGRLPNGYSELIDTLLGLALIGWELPSNLMLCFIVDWMSQVNLHRAIGLLLSYRKKDGRWRFCINYREVNKVKKKDSYPMSDGNKGLHSLG